MRLIIPIFCDHCNERWATAISMGDRVMRNKLVDCMIADVGLEVAIHKAGHILEKVVVNHGQV